MFQKRNARLTALAAALFAVIALPTQIAYPESQPDTDHTISVGQPKIWRYERVYPLLDGMLRDIEAALVQHLPLLNPNEANQAYLDFLRTMVSVQANYNQGIGVKNSTELSKAQDAAKQQQLDYEYLNTLRQDRNSTEKQILAAEQQQSDAQKKLNATTAGSPERDAAQKELDRQTQTVSDLQSRKKQLDTDIGTPGSSTPNLTDAISGDTAKTQPSTLPPFLDTVPDAIKAKLYDRLDKADLPASKQFDNYVTLLNERLAQQLQVITDDASRNGYELFMMQFDVGLYPSQRTKNRVARVEFQMTANAPKGKQPYAYGLIPGTSAYNIQQYIGRSQNLSIVGLFNLLSGLGVRGEYQRQRDQLHTGLVQTVYTSGFENGEASFGWYHGPAPFEDFVTPGLRTTYALVAVPNCTPQLKFTIRKGWQAKKGDIREDPAPGLPYEVDVPTFDAATCKTSHDDPHDLGLKITGIAYQTKPDLSGHGPAQSPASKLGDPAASNASPDDTNTIVLALKNPVDANLTVTVGGKLLKRVRDSRGEAVLTAISDAQGADKTPNPLRGEFEADHFVGDTWMLTNSKTLLLNISEDAAGTRFPVIRLSDSSTEAKDITSLLDPGAEIGINNWRFRATPGMPRSAFLPLFLGPDCQANNDDLKVSLDEVGTLNEVRVAFHPSDPKDTPALNCYKDHRLGEDTLVVLDMGVTGNQWPLTCRQTGNDLICDVPAEACPLAATKPCLNNQSVTVYEASSRITASARFESPDVLPHFETSYQSISYNPGPPNPAWVITVQGIHISNEDTRIHEFLECNNKDRGIPPTVTPIPDLNVLQIEIPVQFYQSCMREDSPDQHYHLVHGAQLSHKAGASSGDLLIQMPDLGWNIRLNTNRYLSVSEWPGGSYQLKSTYSPAFHPDWFTSLSASNGLDSEQELNLPPGPRTPLLFKATKQMLSSKAPYYFHVAVASATFDVTDADSKQVCFDFKNNRQFACESASAVSDSSRKSPTANNAADQKVGADAAPKAQIKGKTKAKAKGEARVGSSVGPTAKPTKQKASTADKTGS